MNNESLYDFVPDNFKAPTVAKTETVAPREVNHQANRPDGENQYNNGFAQKVKEATADSAPKTSVAYEWALLIANRDSSNYIAIKINREFPLANIGENFANEKERYINLYNKELNES